jgi:hypothetical protein
MLAYARIFPAFPAPSAEEWEVLKPGLALRVFPERYENGTLSNNDISDLRHLATAIQNGLTGLITNDTAILKASAGLNEKYGIQVISPGAWKDLNVGEPGEEIFQTYEDDSLSIAPITRAEEAEVHRLLSRLKIPPSDIVAAWAAIDTNDRACNRYGAWSGDVLSGYLMWPKTINPIAFNARAAVDETQPGATHVARLLLGYVIERATAEGTAQLRLTFPAQQAHIREVASSLGFGGLPGETSLSKLAVGHVVTTSNWVNCRDELFRAARVRLPDAPPVYRNVDQQIRLIGSDGNARHISLMKLETLFSPALFCLPGRAAVISPVRPEFAEDLLAHSPQKSLLPHARARLYRERHYLSSAATLKQFKRGNLILFYESAKNKGLGAVVAIARVQRAYLRSQEAMENADLDPSVLDSAGLDAIGRSKTKTVTVFDNIICLKRPVPLATLQRLGCGSPQNLLTTHAINNAQLEEILTEGFAHGTAGPRTYLA